MQHFNSDHVSTCFYVVHLRQSSVKDVNASSSLDTGLCGGKHLILLKLASVSDRSLGEDGFKMSGVSSTLSFTKKA